MPDCASTAASAMHQIADLRGYALGPASADPASGNIDWSLAIQETAAELDEELHPDGRPRKRARLDEELHPDGRPRKRAEHETAEIAGHRKRESGSDDAVEA